MPLVTPLGIHGGCSHPQVSCQALAHGCSPNLVLRAAPSPLAWSLCRISSLQNLGCPTLHTGWPFPCQPVADVHFLRAGSPTAPNAGVQVLPCPPWHRQDPSDAEMCVPRKQAPVGAAPPLWAEGPGRRGLTWAVGFGARALAEDPAGTLRETWDP